MRDKIIIFFLCIAYGILMAHAIIPHHHHDEAACFVPSAEHDHGHQNEHCHDHHHDEHDSHHHKPGEDSDCLLNDLLAVVPVIYKLEDPGFDFDEKYDGNSHYSYTIQGQDTEFYLNIGSIKINRRPYVYSTYNATLTHSHCLRGPPIC